MKKSHLITAGIAFAVAAVVVWSSNNVESAKKALGKDGWF